jgi:arginine repressor
MHVYLQGIYGNLKKDFHVVWQTKISYDYQKFHIIMVQIVNWLSNVYSIMIQDKNRLSKALEYYVSSSISMV